MTMLTVVLVVDGLKVWFQNRRAKFRRNERSVLTQRGSAFNSGKCPADSGLHDSRTVPSPSKSVWIRIWTENQNVDFKNTNFDLKNKFLFKKKQNSELKLKFRLLKTQILTWKTNFY